MVDLADDQPARFVDRASWDLEKGGIAPESLSSDEVDAVLLVVDLTLTGVVFEVHSIPESIPFQRSCSGPLRFRPASGRPFLLLPGVSDRGCLCQERLNPALVAAGGDQPSDGALRWRHRKSSAEGGGECVPMRWAQGTDAGLEGCDCGCIQRSVVSGGGVSTGAGPVAWLQRPSSHRHRPGLGCGGATRWCDLPLLLVVERQPERIAKGHQRPFGGIGFGLLER